MVDPQFGIAPPPPERGIEPRDVLLARVNNDAEVARLRYITGGDGMVMTYIEKQAQALAVHAAGRDAAMAIDEAEARQTYPLLAASIGYEADDLWSVAELVLNRYRAFAAVSFAIERTRLAAKRAITDASDDLAANAAYDAVSWEIKGA